MQTAAIKPSAAARRRESGFIEEARLDDDARVGPEPLN
jgi:hypothetical protein